MCNGCEVHGRKYSILGDEQEHLLKMQVFQALNSLDMRVFLEISPKSASGMTQ